MFTTFCDSDRSFGLASEIVLLFWPWFFIFGMFRKLIFRRSTSKFFSSALKGSALNGERIPLSGDSTNGDSGY